MSNPKNSWCQSWVPSGLELKRRWSQAQFPSLFCLASIGVLMLVGCSEKTEEPTAQSTDTVRAEKQKPRNAAPVQVPSGPTPYEQVQALLERTPQYDIKQIQDYRFSGKVELSSLREMFPDWSRSPDKPLKASFTIRLLDRPPHNPGTIDSEDTLMVVVKRGKRDPVRIIDRGGDWLNGGRDSVAGMDKPSSDHQTLNQNLYRPLLSLIVQAAGAPNEKPEEKPDAKSEEQTDVKPDDNPTAPDQSDEPVD